MPEEQTSGVPEAPDGKKFNPNFNEDIPEGVYNPRFIDEEQKGSYPESPNTPAESDKTSQEELNQAAVYNFATDDFEPGDYVGDSRAVRLVVKRLTDLGVKQVGSRNEFTAAKAELARKIVAMIPDDLQTGDVLKNADLRPMLDEIGFKGEVHPDSADETSTVAGMQFSKLERTLAGEALISAQTKITTTYEKLLIDELPDSMGPDARAAEIERIAAFVDNVANEWRGGQVNRIEETIAGDRRYNSVTGEIENIPDEDGNSSQLLDDFAGFDAGLDEESNTMVRFMNQRDIQKLVQSGELDLDTLNDLDTGEEIIVDGQVVTGQTRIQYEDASSMTNLIRGGPDPRADSVGVLSPQGEEETKWADKEWYSVRETRRLYNDMDQAEKLALTDKMKKAGLFDLVGREPVIPGDTTDPAFKAAWEHLIKSSLEQGKPMTELLAERVSAFDREQQSALSTKLTDPARLRINANGYARDVIGRHMTDEEQSAMVEFMHELERKNAKVEAGLESDDPETQLDEATVADIDARMQEYIRDENAVEAGGKDVADQYEQFTQMLSGPGRGVR